MFSSNTLVKHAARWAGPVVGCLIRDIQWTGWAHLGCILRAPRLWVDVLHIFFCTNSFLFGDCQPSNNLAKRISCDFLAFLAFLKDYNSFPSSRKLIRGKRIHSLTEQNTKQEDVLRNAPVFNPLKRGIATISSSILISCLFRSLKLWELRKDLNALQSPCLSPIAFDL